jgi:hypothetical protein
MTYSRLLRTDPTAAYHCNDGEECPWCDGIHYGQNVCAYSPERMKQQETMNANRTRRLFLITENEHNLTLYQCEQTLDNHFTAHGEALLVVEKPLPQFVTTLYQSLTGEKPL